MSLSTTKLQEKQTQLRENSSSSVSNIQTNKISPGIALRSELQQNHRDPFRSALAYDHTVDCDVKRMQGYELCATQEWKRPVTFHTPAKETEVLPHGKVAQLSRLQKGSLDGLSRGRDSAASDAANPDDTQQYAKELQSIESCLASSSLVGVPVDTDTSPIKNIEPGSSLLKTETPFASTLPNISNASAAAATGDLKPSSQDGLEVEVDVDSPLLDRYNRKLRTGKRKEFPIPAEILALWQKEIQTRLEQDVYQIIDQQLAEVPVKKANVEIELCMAGYISRGAKSVTMRPTVWLACSSKKCKAAMQSSIMDLRYLMVFSQGRIEVRGSAPFLGASQSTASKPLIVFDFSTSSFPVGNGNILHLHFQRPRAKCFTPGLKLLVTLTNNGAIIRQQCSTIGGFIQIDDKIYGCTTAHGILEHTKNSAGETKANFDSSNDAKYPGTEIGGATKSQKRVFMPPSSNPMKDSKRPQIRKMVAKYAMKNRPKPPLTPPILPPHVQRQSTTPPESISPLDFVSTASSHFPPSATTSSPPTRIGQIQPFYNYSASTAYRVLDRRTKDCSDGIYSSSSEENVSDDATETESNVDPLLLHGASLRFPERPASLPDTNDPFWEPMNDPFRELVDDPFCETKNDPSWEPVLQCGPTFYNSKGSMKGGTDQLSCALVSCADFSLLDLGSAIFSQLRSQYMDMVVNGNADEDVSLTNISSYIPDAELKEGPVFTLNTEMKPIQGYLLGEASVVVSKHGINRMRKIQFDSPLAPGTSGSWVVRGSALCGVVVAIYKSRPYVHMISAEKFLSDIKMACALDTHSLTVDCNKIFGEDRTDELPMIKRREEACKASGNPEVIDISFGGPWSIREPHVSSHYATWRHL